MFVGGQSDPVFTIPSAPLTVTIAETGYAGLSTLLRVTDADTDVAGWDIDGAAHNVLFQLQDPSPTSYDRNLIMQTGQILDYETDTSYEVVVRFVNHMRMYDIKIHVLCDIIRVNNIL